MVTDFALGGVQVQYRSFRLLMCHYCICRVEFLLTALSNPNKLCKIYSCTPEQQEMICTGCIGRVGEQGLDIWSEYMSILRETHR